MERQYPNNLNDLELAKAFKDAFVEQYKSSLENNSRGFTLEFCDDDETPFFRFTIEDVAYNKLGNDEEFTNELITGLSNAFVACYKVKYQYA